MPKVIYKVFYLRSPSLVAVLEISYRLARDRITGRKFMKMIGKKTEKLQKSAWDDKIFDRE